MTVETLFAWIGSLVVNIAFIAAISWGSTTNWVLAFGVSILYTVILFGAALLLDKYGTLVLAFGLRNSREVEDIDRYNEQNMEEAMEDDEGSSETPHRSFLVSILYGLGVLAMGVTTFFLPTNLTPCEQYYHYGDDSADGWQTNYTNLPNEVKQWAQSTSWQEPHPNTFLQLKNGIILFQGSDGQGIWNKLLVAAGGRITSLDYSEPKEFTAVSDSLACFASDVYSVERNPGVGCSDGTALRVYHNHTTYTPFHLRVFRNSSTLWFKDYAPGMPDFYKHEESNHVIYSLDPATMQATLHSTRKTTQDATSNSYGTCRRKQALFALCVSALPVLVVSLWLWFVRHPPPIATMSGTTWVGLTAVYLCICCMVVPNRDVFDLLKWWGSIAGAIWIVLLVNYAAVAHDSSAPAIAWGLQIGGLSYCMAMIFVLELFNDTDSHPLRWIVMNVAVVAPMGLLGIAMDVSLLLALSAIGLFLDSCQVASRLADRFPGNEALFILLVGLCGVGIAVSGWFLQRHQQRIRDRLHSGLERYAWHPHEAEGLVVVSNDDGEQVESVSYDLRLHEEEPTRTA